MVGDSVSVHSSKHLEILLSDLNADEAMYDVEHFISNDEATERPTAELRSSASNRSEPKFEILTIDRGSHENMDSSGSLTGMQIEAPHDEIVDEGYSQRNFETLTDSHDTDLNDSMDVHQLKQNYKELAKDYENYQKLMATDSSEEQLQKQDIYDEFQDPLDSMERNSFDFDPQTRRPKEDTSNESSTQPIKEINARKCTPGRKISNPVPRFKYKEPVPKFVQQNKLALTNGNKSSYCQRYLAEKDISKNKQKSRTKHKISQQEDNLPSLNNSLSSEHDFLSDNVQNSASYGYGNASSIASHMDSSGTTNNLKYLRENIEISRLDEMIREEENNLKNSVLTVSEPQIPYEQYPQVESYGPQVESYGPQVESYGFVDSQQHSYPHDNKRLFPESVDYAASTISKKDEHNKRLSYAELHSVQNERPPIETENASSYAAQHIEKKAPHNYKMYSLKEYRALSKDIKLQQSLGPDLQSNAYRERKARAEKQREYATSVARQNQQLVATKKVRSAPAPSTKDRVKESRRLAALEYAKNIKTFSKKPSKSSIRPRPATDDRKEITALEIMKQRHETEKKQIDEMRKSLAGIISKVKS